MALGIFTNYAEIGERARTNWRALATDIFVQDSWRPNEKLTVEGGFRYAIWPPWSSTTNNIANFDPRFYSTTNAAVINPSTGRLVSGPRYNGIVLPGDGFVGEGNDLKVASDPAVQALFRGEPRGFSQTHYDLFEPRVGVSYAWNDKTVLRGSSRHLPQPRHAERLDAARRQPAVPADGHRVERQRGQSRRRGVRQRPPLRHAGAGPGVQAAGVVHVVGRHSAPAAVEDRPGRELRRPPRLLLQRERNINQLQPGTIQANPGVNIAALRPYKGYGALRVSENSGDSEYHSIQISGERRYSNGFKLSVAYTYGKSIRQRQRQAQRPLEFVRRRQLLGAVELRPDARAGRLLHLRPAVLARPEHADAQPARRLADLRGHVPPVRDALLDHPDQRHRGRGRRQQRPAGRPRGRHVRGTRTASSRPAPASTPTSRSTPPRSPTRPRASSATRPATSCGTRARSSGTSRSSRTSCSEGGTGCSSARKCSTSSTIRT